ncbi:MAG: agmatine deiminase family protein [Acidobacteriaceae bacterium]
MSASHPTVDTDKTTPHALGLRMPAEWEQHAATWIAWPHNAEDWPGKFQPIPWVYGEIVRHLAGGEHVHILVNEPAAEKRARNLLARCGADLKNVAFHLQPTDRVWLRDFGPIFLTPTDASATAPPLAITNWKFNAWAKYDNWHNDDQVPAHVARLLSVPAWMPEIPLAGGQSHRVVLEGGSIDVNGAGTLLTTEECLLSDVQSRNPGATREQLEHCFHDHLGIDQVIWLNRGIAGDDTHGHVDDIARFVGRNTIVAAVEPNRDDENHAPLRENLERLHAARMPDGKPYRIVELPLPSPVLFEGQRLPASYANFYIANGLVLVPTFNDANDRIALNILAELFPRRRIIGIHSVDFIWGLGAMHCMTQQQPAIYSTAASAFWPGAPS